MHILSFIHITQNSQAVLFCDAKILNWRFPPLKKISIWRVPDQLRIRQKLADMITRPTAEFLQTVAMNIQETEWVAFLIFMFMLTFWNRKLTFILVAAPPIKWSLI